MSLHALPAELLLAVALLLPRPALAALARASSRLRPVAQRVLYRHVSASAASRNLAVVPLLARKPHIARHVRSFYIALDPLSPLFSRFYSILAIALHNMSELHSLHLLVDPSVSWVLRDPCVYPKLVHLTSTFPLDGNVVRFLRETPSLLELEVDSMSACTLPVPDLAATSIPRLEYFVGSPSAAALIVPGRPVKSIHLNGATLAEDVVPLLARSTAPVLVLGAVTNSSPVSFLQLLHRHLPHLAYLRVMSTQSLFQPPSPEFYEQVATVLASFSELNAFELSGMHWGSQRKRDDESKRVWQSSPLSSGTHDDLLFGTDILLAY